MVTGSVLFSYTKAYFYDNGIKAELIGIGREPLCPDLPTFFANFLRILEGNLHLTEQQLWGFVVYDPSVLSSETGLSGNENQFGFREMASGHH